MTGPCMCGDIQCPSCGPAQGNSRCEECGAWGDEGCQHNPLTEDEDEENLRNIEAWKKHANDAAAALIAHNIQRSASEMKGRKWVSQLQSCINGDGTHQDMQDIVNEMREEFG